MNAPGRYYVQQEACDKSCGFVLARIESKIGLTKARTLCENLVVYMPCCL